MKSEKQKKPNRKKLKSKLDRLFSEYIRLRDNNICFTCGSGPSNDVIQCGHLVTRAREVVRWDERNGHAQCRSCNFKHEHYPEQYTLMYILKYGKDEYEKLVRDSWENKKLTLTDIENLIECYQNKIKDIYDNRTSR